jgi:hypothetical protein
MPVWKITQIARIDDSIVRRIRKRAISRGWDKENKGLILLDYVTNDHDLEDHPFSKRFMTKS